MTEPARTSDTGHPRGVFRVVPKTLAEQLDIFAALAVGDWAGPLLEVAERAANAILDAQGTMAVWEVRVHLAKVGRLANDGKEDLDALGALGRSMRLKAIGRERPPLWAMKLLPAGHLNLNTRWRRPETFGERRERMERDP